MLKKDHNLHRKSRVYLLQFHKYKKELMDMKEQSLMTLL